MSSFKSILDILKSGGSKAVAHVPGGFDAMIVADVVRGLRGREGPASLVYIARDGQRAQALQNTLGFLAPELEVLAFPAWDCQPYDRVSPGGDITAQRMTSLAKLAGSRTSEDKPRLLLTSVNAVLQRVLPLKKVASEAFSAAPGNAVNMNALAGWLDTNGFHRASTVRDTGEYAVRGGILDLYAPGLATPVRLDFFGETLESIRPFDPETQRSSGWLRSLDFVPVSEAQLTTETIKRFRQGYAAAFGAPRGDALYEAVSEGRRYPGLEHWLPLFQDKLGTLFDYVGGVPIVFETRCEEAVQERLTQVQDYYEARRSALDQPQSGIAPYRPLKPEALYLTAQEWKERTESVSALRLNEGEAVDALEGGARKGRDFSPERNDDEANVFDAAIAYVREAQGLKRRVVLAAGSEGSRERLSQVLKDHGLKNIVPVGTLATAMALRKDETAIAVWNVETGFETDDLRVVSEQDILGDRLIRKKRKARRPQDIISEAGGLSPGDLIVHTDHGIGRFSGLKTIEAAGAPHDCLEIDYAGETRLFLPVENIELITRYGSEDADVALDKLGGGAWQARKARMKKRIRDMAAGLIKIAAARMTNEAPKILPPEGVYDEFCARFPYEETEDQLGAIEAVLGDLASGRPMDRLVCGDVGFGKTEVALRAAFTVAMSGKQVAVVVPTTLLARQHYKGFKERFQGLPLKVAQASRFVPAADMKGVKEGLGDGTIDIVIGTHALLGKAISFKDLGLIVVDEEQHFGVSHKEKLKGLRAEAHVLTLSATPIPRTLQLAMTGVRELSIIATPPVDRLAVRSFTMPFDPLPIREALLRERYRGGQAFYVVPRIDDLQEVRDFLAKNVPEAKVAVAHGQMAAGQLEDIMTAFYEGRFDILLSTTIVESGLDIPTANTLIVHRADMFGLSQLYQLRGRVGRSKTRAYALFTVPADRAVTPQAEKRLEVLQSLDTLGAGFQLASHDLDIRGAGNLLGEEQSGHIREVGYEMYQQMLEDAVAMLKAGIKETEEEAWSPSITIGTAVTIPETYVPDLVLRLQIYRRLSTLETDDDIHAFGAELVDRFGPLPEEVDQLLKIVAIKVLCRRANIEKVDAGPKGLILSFRDNAFSNPAGLMKYISEQGVLGKVRPDMKVVLIRDFDAPEERLKGTATVLRSLVGIAEKKAA